MTDTRASKKINKKRTKTDTNNSSSDSDVEKVTKKLKKSKKDKKEKKDKKDKKEKKEKREKKSKKEDDTNNILEEKEDVEEEKEKEKEEDILKTKTINNEILKYNDEIDMNKTDFNKYPWFNNIKEQFSNIIWSKDLNETPTILVIFTEKECDSFINMLSSIYHQELSFSSTTSTTTTTKNKRFIIGFDTEGKIPYSIQLSTKTISAVIYIKAFKNSDLTPTLIELLQDKSIIKSGVGVKNDFDHLLNSYPTIFESLKCQSSLDVACVSFRNGITNNYLSLDILSIDLLNSEKYKFNRDDITIMGSISQQQNNREDWINHTLLKMHQHKYAAIDAWLGFKLAETLYINLKNDSSFYDWSKSNLTGNFQFKNKNTTTTTTNKEIKIIFDENNKINYFPNKMSNYNNNNNNNYKPKTTNINMSSEKSEKYEKANNHENLLKLQQIKKSSTKRPFI